MLQHQVELITTLVLLRQGIPFEIRRRIIHYLRKNHQEKKELRTIQLVSPIPKQLCNLRMWIPIQDNESEEEFYDKHQLSFRHFTISKEKWLNTTSKDRAISKLGIFEHEHVKYPISSLTHTIECTQHNYQSHPFYIVTIPQEYPYISYLSDFHVHDPSSILASVWISISMVKIDNFHKNENGVWICDSFTDPYHMLPFLACQYVDIQICYKLLNDSQSNEEINISYTGYYTTDEVKRCIVVNNYNLLVSNSRVLRSGSGMIFYPLDTPFRHMY